MSCMPGVCMGVRRQRNGIKRIPRTPILPRTPAEIRTKAAVTLIRHRNQGVVDTPKAFGFFLY